MPEKTAISWTDATWNPVHGCSRVSEGCRFCYAETLSRRYGHTPKPWTFGNASENVLLKPHKLREPYAWKEPKRVFVNSMSDLFHEQIPDEYIARVFAVMTDLPRHRFQILTKRPARAAAWPGPWPENIWMGTSVADRKSLRFLDDLRPCPARTLFLSFEPLIEDLGSPDLSGFHWAIAGGESGSHLSDPKWTHRHMDHAWARSIRDACQRDGVAFFFKQSSGHRTELGVALEHRDGTFWIWQQYPGIRRMPVRVPHQINGSDLGRYIRESFADQIRHGEAEPTLF